MSGLGWRAVFLINLPIVLVAFPATVSFVPADRPRVRRRLDLPGAGSAALTLAAIVYAVINIDHGPADLHVWGPAVLAVVALVAFVLRERFAKAPMLPLALLRSPAFAGANVVAAAMNFVGIGGVFVATLYLQTVQHRPAFVAGAMLLPLFVPLAAMAPLTGRIVARVGPRPPITAGLLVGAAGSLAMVGLAPGSGYLRLLPVLLGLGLGMGLLTAAVVAAAVRAVPPDRSGLASGVNNTARQTAGALAVALYGVIAGTPTDPVDFTAGLHHIGVLGGALWALALALTWATIPGRTDRAAGTDAVSDSG